jgi:hypothetical protein
MKSSNRSKTSFKRRGIPWIHWKRKEKKAFLASIQQADEQCDRLGLLDPLELEPAILYFPSEEEEK